MRRTMYLDLLGIECRFDNFSIVDIKNETMNFEANGSKFIQPLDPYQGPRYMEPMEEVMERDVLDHIYHMTTWKRTSYNNHTFDGSISWRIIHSFDSNSKEATHEW